MIFCYYQIKEFDEKLVFAQIGKEIPVFYGIRGCMFVI